MMQYTAVCRNNHGATLISALVIMILLLVLGISSMMIITTQSQIGAHYYEAARAFYLAEAGLQRAASNLKANNHWADANPSDAFAGNNDLGNGTYVVQAEANTPNPGQVRITSTGQAATASAVVQAIAISQPGIPILDYATLSCGNLKLDGTENNAIDGNVFVKGDIDLIGSGTQQIEGNATAIGNIKIEGTSRIDGNVHAQGNVELNSSAAQNITGDAKAGESVTNSSKVGGTSTSGAAAPVNQCSDAAMGGIAITRETITNLQSQAGYSTSANYVVSGGSTITHTGVVRLTNGNLDLSGNITLSGNVIFIVDTGNVTVRGPGKIQSSPPGSTITFIVQQGNMEVLNGGNYAIDGTLHVGTINANGTDRQGGNIYVKDNSNLTVNGNVLAVNGNIEADAGGKFTVNATPPVDPNLAASFRLTQWREIKN